MILRLQKMMEVAIMKVVQAVQMRWHVTMILPPRSTSGCLYPVDLYGSPYVDCDGDCINDADGDEVCDEDEIAGCLDEGACNYDPNATDYDVTLCDYSCLGCTDAAAANFDPNGDHRRRDLCVLRTGH